MFDLSKAALVLRESSIAGVSACLKNELPARAEVIARDTHPPEIWVQDGIWRGASLVFDDSGNELKLTGIGYRIPGFTAKVIILIASVAVFSIIIMTVVGAVTGTFEPMVIGIGGAAGAGMYVIVERLVMLNIRGAWSQELHRAMEKISAEQTGADISSPPVTLKRPLGVTIVAWILVVLSLIGLAGTLYMMSSPDYSAALARFHLPVAVQKILTLAGLAVNLLSGIFMLKGAGWARWLYIIWGAFSILATFANLGFTPLAIPGILIYALFTAVLLQKNSSIFFSGGRRA